MLLLITLTLRAFLLRFISRMRPDHTLMLCTPYSILWLYDSLTSSMTLWWPLLSGPQEGITYAELSLPRPGELSRAGRARDRVIYATIDHGRAAGVARDTVVRTGQPSDQRESVVWDAPHSGPRVMSGGQNGRRRTLVWVRQVVCQNSRWCVLWQCCGSSPVAVVSRRTVVCRARLVVSP